MAHSATSSTEEMMTLLLLEQVERALTNIEYVRKDFAAALGAGPPQECETELFQQFYEADVCCHEQLGVVVYVARLTSAPGYQTASRLERLRQLIDSFVHAAGLMLQAAKEIKTNGSVECWEGRKSLFENAVEMVSGSVDCLNLAYGGGQSLGSSISVATKETYRDGQTSLVDADRDFGLRDVHRYLHDNSTYEWPRNVKLALTRCNFTEDERAEVVIQQPTHPYKQIGTITQPLWNNVPLDGDGLKNGAKLRFDNINAVWLSPNADSVLDKTNPQTYREFLDAITDVAHDPKLARQESRYRPLCLARALLSMGIDLGILFDDDLSVLVWPFGKANAVRGHYAVVQCGFYGDLDWRYRVVAKVQGDNVRVPLRPSLKKHHKLSTASNTAKATIAAPAGQTHRRRKPVSFLDLPAELRNTIYADYLTYQFEGHEVDDIDRELREYYVWTHRWQNLATVVLPEICVTCRQIRDEVVPLYLSNKHFHANLGWKFTSTAPIMRGRFMTEQNRWMSTVPSSAYLRDLEFRLRTLRSGRIQLRLRNEAPGFELEVQLWSRVRNRRVSVVVDWEQQLRELVRIVVQDRVTDGLSVADVAAIADFLNVHCER